MSSNYRRISVITHGSWGTGKSWLAATCPGPRLVLDIEGGQEDTPQEKHEWDLRKPLPKLGNDVSVIVDITSWDTVEQAMSILESGDHPFESVVLDSISELQKVLKDRISNGPDAVFDQQAWGRLLNNLEGLSRRLRDLTRKGAARRVNVVITAGTDDEKVKKKYLLQGGIRKNLSGLVDLVGYLSVEKGNDGQQIHVLRIQPSELIEAKCRLHKLSVAHGDFIVEPDIKEMIKVVNT